MSIFGALFSGVSGLNAQSQKMAAISDNIANSGTIGYKRTEVPFSTLVTSQAVRNTYSPGGVRANPVMQIDQQGLLQSTNSTTDLAINGRGFFVVNTSAEPITGGISNRTLFTRAGSFQPDANGNLRNTAGYYLQGWRLDSSGAFENGEPARTSFAGLETINITGLNFTGSPTTQINFAGNLPAGETGGTIDGNPIVTGVEYFDPLGNPQIMNLSWTPKTTEGQWVLDLIPSGSTTPLASYQIDFYTSGANAGTPRSIVEVPSVVGTRNLATVTDNPNTFTGDRITVTVSGTTINGAGQTITGTVAGSPFSYTTVASDSDPNQFATNLAAYLGGLGIPGVASVTANSSGQLTVVGTDDLAGASLIENGSATINGNQTVTEAIAVNDTAPGAADTVQVTLSGTTVTGAGQTITGTVAGQPFTYTTVAGDTAVNTLATNLATYLNGLGLTNVASVTNPSAGVVLVTATNDAAGETLVSSGPTSFNTTVTQSVDSVTGDSANTFAGDVATFDMSDGAASFSAGDIITVRVGGHTFQRTLAAGDLISDNALAAFIAAQINIEAASIPGFTAGSAVASGALITITGDNDVDGASLAGGNNAVGAITVSRDTTAASQFVDADGNSITPTLAGDDIISRLTIALPGGATQNIDLNLGQIATLEGLTQFSGDYTPTEINRDGAQFGSLDRVEVDENGVMNAVFNNGQVRAIYRLPLIEFVNPNGLLPVDGNAFQNTVDSGSFYLWDAGVGPVGDIASSSLEQSTVDIAEEFSNMIVTQRAYSSNARVIQTADEMLQEITNLKR